MRKLLLILSFGLLLTACSRQSATPVDALQSYTDTLEQTAGSLSPQQASAAFAKLDSLRQAAAKADLSNKDWQRFAELQSKCASLLFNRLNQQPQTPADTAQRNMEMMRAADALMKDIPTPR